MHELPPIIWSVVTQVDVPGSHTSGLQQAPPPEQSPPWPPQLGVPPPRLPPGSSPEPPPLLLLPLLPAPAPPELLPLESELLPEFTSPFCGFAVTSEVPGAQERQFELLDDCSS